MAPQFWGITRKDKRFVITVRPGAHSKHISIPSAVFLRDTIKIVSSLREAKASIYSGNVTIDGVKRKSLHHGIGLMDIVELENVDDIYRLVPSDGTILRPVKIDSAEKTKKICKVTGKSTMKKGKMQMSFHDGRSLVTNQDANVGDSCLMQVPEQKIIEVIKLEKDVLAIVTKGINAGQVGTITEIKKGTFVLPRMATLKLGERDIEIPTSILMAVGRDKPVIQIR